MGLDQYARAINPNDNGYPNEISLGEWRKHPNLQGWMERLWRSKGGEGQFNCVSVELTGDDLQRLRIDVDHRDLPSTQGFFFGSDSDEYYKEQDLTFVEEALELIEAGYKIEYSSWW